MNITNNLELLFDGNRNDAGIAIRAIKDGDTIYEKCLGYANIEHKVPITTDSVFNIASVSKPFTALAIMKLAEDRMISYSDFVTKYIPEISHYGNNIRINHLLNHSSGLIDYFDLLYKKARNNSLHATNKECLKLLKKQDKLLFKPGEKYCYCNANYVFLSIIIERITGSSFFDYLRNKIFIPLGMNSTYIFDEKQPIIPKRAYGYEIDDKNSIKCCYVDTLTTGASGLFSSIEDLTKWDKALYTDKLISKDDFELLITPGKDNFGKPFAVDSWGKYSYSFGWMLNGKCGKGTMWHTGGDAGFRSLLVRFYKEKFSVIMLSNLNNINWENWFNLVNEINNMS